MNLWSKLRPLECTQGFSKIWPGDLVFDPIWGSFKLDLDVLMINILTKFIWGSFKLDLDVLMINILTTKRPSFGPDMTQFQTWPRYYDD